MSLPLEVFDAPRGADHDVDALLQRADLTRLRHATVDLGREESDAAGELLDVRSICSASSRVGARMSARGERPYARFFPAWARKTDSTRGARRRSSYPSRYDRGPGRRDPRGSAQRLPPGSRTARPPRDPRGHGRCSGRDRARRTRRPRSWPPEPPRPGDARARHRRVLRAPRGAGHDPGRNRPRGRGARSRSYPPSRRGARSRSYPPSRRGAPIIAREATLATRGTIPVVPTLATRARSSREKPPSRRGAYPPSRRGARSRSYPPSRRGARSSREKTAIATRGIPTLTTRGTIPVIPTLTTRGTIPVIPTLTARGTIPVETGLAARRTVVGTDGAGLVAACLLLSGPAALRRRILRLDGAVAAVLRAATAGTVSSPGCTLPTLHVLERGLSPAPGLEILGRTTAGGLLVLRHCSSSRTRATTTAIGQSSAGWAWAPSGAHHRPRDSQERPHHAVVPSRRRPA